MNETLNKVLTIMSNQEVAKSIAATPPDSLPHVTTSLKALQPTRVKLGIHSNFDGDRAQGHAFLMSCELYISLTALDFVNEQVCIHWALSYFKGRCAARALLNTFYGRRCGQELCALCARVSLWRNLHQCSGLENEATTALMQLKSYHYFQGKWNVEAYIDKFKDLVDLSGDTDPIAIMLKFCQGLNSMTQDRIAESVMDRLQDMDFNSWFKAA
jgi:hypothetical protein